MKYDKLYNKYYFVTQTIKCGYPNLTTLGKRQLRLLLRSQFFQYQLLSSDVSDPNKLSTSRFMILFKRIKMPTEKDH
ncbi:hypothetical protein VI35_10455 [Aeromonas caviae]|nr:hypothetical protein VI35_10455 [Aeromonas caviae]